MNTFVICILQSGVMACAEAASNEVCMKLTRRCNMILDQYVRQRSSWPTFGRHILAQYDRDSIVVYQAYKPSIASYAVEHQRFGGPDFDFNRMSWIKTNFLWMMYRCGWATKHNQERVLAVRITRDGFDKILANAYTVEKSQNVRTCDITVRLQWDPDHTPNFHKENRRAIQLGLKGETLRKYGEDWIVDITDITDMVKSMKKDYDTGGPEKLWTPKEVIYKVTDPAVCQRINLSSESDPQTDLGSQISSESRTSQAAKKENEATAQMASGSILEQDGHRS